MLRAASLTAEPFFSNAPDRTVTPMGVPISGNLLGSAFVPLNTTVGVTHFSVAGSGKAFTPGPDPVTLTSPVTGQSVGVLVIQADGSYTFTPTPGHVGPVPAISVSTRSSDGQVAVSALTLDVTNRELSALAAINRRPRACMHTCTWVLPCCIGSPR